MIPVVVAAGTYGLLLFGAVPVQAAMDRVTESLGARTMAGVVTGGMLIMTGLGFLGAGWN